MKRKRAYARRKPKKPAMVSVNKTSDEEECQDADQSLDMDGSENDGVDSTMEAELAQVVANISGGVPVLNKRVIDNMVEVRGTSLGTMNTTAISGGNPCQKAGRVATTKPSRVCGSSSTDPNRYKTPAFNERAQGIEPRSPYQDPRYNEQELNAALSVIKKVMKMDAAVPFNDPVDPVALGIPDYYDVVDIPMDFSTICNNLENGLKYMNSEDVFRDVECIWDNCCKYSKKGDYILELMKRLKNNFMKLWTTSGLYKEPPQACNGYPRLHEHRPAESTMRNDNYGGSVSSIIRNSKHHQQQSNVGWNHVQQSQPSPCCSPAHQAQQLSCYCQSGLSFRDLEHPQSQKSSYVKDAEYTMRHKPHNQALAICQAGNCNCDKQQHGEKRLSGILPQSSHSCTILPQDQHLSCQYQSHACQPQATQLLPGTNINDSGHRNLEFCTMSTLARRKHEYDCNMKPVIRSGNFQQYPRISSTIPVHKRSRDCAQSCRTPSHVQAPQPSVSYDHRDGPDKQTRQCHSSSSHSQISPRGTGINAGNADSTLRCRKRRLQYPLSGVADDPDTVGQSQVQEGYRSQEVISQKQMNSTTQPSQNPPQSKATNGSEDSATLRKKRGRGPTRLLKLLGEGKRISVNTNELGQAIGPEAPKLISFLGLLARNGYVLPLTYVDWRAMPDANKEEMWQQVQSKFDIDPNSKSWILKSLGKKWKDWKSKLKTAHYNPHATDEERLADRDERVLPDQWAALISHWNSEEGEKRSARNRANRAQQKFGHTIGTKSFARIREEERAKRADGKEPSRAELFILTRTRKDGQPVNEASSAIISQLKELVSQQKETSENGTAKDDIFFQVMGEEHGRVLSYGLGASPDLGATRPSRADAMRMVSEANAEVREMKERMAVMENTCTQMATQMAAMMSMMSSMHKILPEKSNHDTNTDIDIPAAAEGRMQQQVQSTPDCDSQPRETRAKRRGKTLK